MADQVHTQERTSETGVQRLMSVDPGGTSGICTLILPKGTMRTFQIGPEEHHGRLYQAMSLFGPHTVIGESFQQRSGVEGINLIPNEYIGVIKLWVAQVGLKELYWQSLSQTEFWDDGKLKRLSLYQPTRPHAMDAVRHMLTYLQKTKHPLIDGMLVRLK